MKQIALIALLTVMLSVVALIPSTRLYAGKAFASNENSRFPMPDEAASLPQSGLGPSIVSANGRQLVVRKRNPDGSLASSTPYIIRGVAWSPAGTDTISLIDDPMKGRRIQFGIWGPTDIPMIKNMNANTVFTYMDVGLDSTGLAVLDTLYNNNLMIVMTVYDGGADTTRAQQAVNFFKNHPAILAWNLGTEWNINPPIPVADMAVRIQNAAATIKALDANHPITTSYGDIDIADAGLRLADTRNYVNNICTSVDLWALNIYRSSNFGTLFDQWRAISKKPMLLGEFGTDAFRSFNQSHPPSGNVDETMQKQWVLSEWNHLSKNLSANHPGNSALGGFVFEWNDEWWKVSPAGSQQVDGCDGAPCGGHPDNFGNEEYFGLVALNALNSGRSPRSSYQTLTQAYAANYQPPANKTIIFRAASAHCLVANTSCGFATFYKDNALFYSHSGGGGGGRGFNVAVIDPCTGELIQPPQNFDTWLTRFSGTAMTDLTNFLNGLPNGVLVMLAVADEAGLTQDNSCTHYSFPWIEPFYQAVEALGGTQIHIRNYCFRNSWSMVAVKGEGVARDEKLDSLVEVSSQTMFSIQSATAPLSRSFAGSFGSGAIHVSVPSGCNWTAVSNDSSVTITSGSSGTGNGVVTYNVAPNSGLIRTATITVAGQLFTITQADAGQSGGRTPFEFDADPKTDLATWHPSNGLWHILNSMNGSDRFVTWGINSDNIVPGDYDGDGKIDIAVWRSSSGTWFIINSTDGSFRGVDWGSAGDIPVPADYDGDGKTDIAVWRPSSGTWYIINSSNGTVNITGWGNNTDKPVPADYDGDGKADIAAWRPSSGTWYIINSSSGSASLIGWGVNGDKAIPADYDGDSKADIAVWRPANGTWFIIRSSNGSVGVVGWGVSSDKPVVGDFDGDGKADIAVWRPVNGTWFIINSSTGAVSAPSWGANGDIPIPSAYVF